MSEVMDEVVVAKDATVATEVNATPEPSNEGKKEEKLPASTNELPRDVVEEIQKKSFGYAFQLVDSALKEAGYDKPDGVKTTDFIKNVLTERTKPEANNVKTTDDGDSVAKIKALQDQLREKENLITQLSESTTKQKRDFFLKSVVDSANITPPAHLGETEQKRYIDRVKSLMTDGLTKNYLVKEVDNQFRFYKSDGEPLFDGTVDMNPLSPNELLKREFSEFLSVANVTPTQKSPTGTGGIEKASTEGTVASTVPNTVKTKYEFYDYLQKDKGYVIGDKNFTEAVQKAMKEKPSMFK
jgi:hypothetical protein